MIQTSTYRPRLSTLKFQLSTLQVSVSYFGTEVGRFKVSPRLSLSDIFSYIRSRLVDIVGMVTVTLRSFPEGKVTRHRLMLGAGASEPLPVAPAAPVQLTLF